MKWDSKPLGEFCKLVNGKAFKADDWSETGLPIIRIQNLNDSTKPFNHWDGSLDRQVHVQDGDLLIAWSGTPGTSFGAHIWGGAEGVLNQHIFRVDLVNGEVTKEWLKFCVNIRLLRLIDQAHGGVGLKHVTKGAVEAVQIPLPPLAEQKRIAGILDAADALRAKRRESLAQLDTLLQSTFLDMFGDPVTNPMGWDMSMIGEVTTCLDRLRKPVKADDRVDGDIPYYGANGQQGWINEALFDEPLVLVAEDGGHFDTPERGVAYRIDGPAWVNNHAHVLRALQSVEVEYLHRALRHYDFSPYISGSTRAKLNQKQLNKAKLLVPPLDLQHRFATIVESVEQQKARQRAHLAELDTLFASLQSRAFRGDL